ncbi:MAG: M57 family metalloprotease [Kofleriaceae bacterium]
MACNSEPQLSQEETNQEIISNLQQAGFPADDIMVVDDVVYVGRDAAVSLEASREMLEVDSSQEQYRTTNLVSRTLPVICVRGTTFTGTMSTGLNLAIQNYNQLALTFTMRRITTSTTGCSAVIQANLISGAGGVAGFPSGGRPYTSINIGTGTAAYGADVVEHVITHELGHCVGFRHSDYYNRSISCGTGGNEGSAGVGAILIPGTPATATRGGSIMNSCFRSVETGEFTSTDRTALQYLY